MFLDEFTILLILAYFRDKSYEYVLTDLSDLLGIQFPTLFSYIDFLINEELLCIEKKQLIRLTFKGRLLLMHSNMELYSFSDDFNNDEDHLQKSNDVNDFFINTFEELKWWGNK